MTSRRRFLTVTAGAALLASRGSHAQPVFRLGVLAPGPRNPYQDAFFETLRVLGYTDGVNLSVERRLVPPPEYPPRILELVRAKPDVIYAMGSAAVRATMNATRDIAVVATDLETDPVASGYAQSLARPGGNLTGIFLDLPEFSAKRLELLREALPTVSNVMVLWDATQDRAPLSRMDTAAQAMKLRLILAEMQDPQDLAGAFAGSVKQQAHALLVMQSPVLDANNQRILALAVQHKLPVIAMFSEFAAGGALISYGPNAHDMVARTANYVGKVLKGIKPGNLPIQRPVKFDLVVNLKTAKSFGLRIAESVLVRATEVIR